MVSFERIPNSPEIIIDGVIAGSITQMNESIVELVDDMVRDGCFWPCSAEIVFDDEDDVFWLILDDL
jgi:hypothetical protein